MKQKQGKRSSWIDALEEWSSRSDPIRIRVRGKRVKNSQWKERLSTVASMWDSARWQGRNVNGLVDPNRSRKGNGPYCPVTVETKNLSGNHARGRGQSWGTWVVVREPYRNWECGGKKEVLHSTGGRTPYIHRSIGETTSMWLRAYSCANHNERNEN
jgi:hypothetical protein